MKNAVVKTFRQGRDSDLVTLAQRVLDKMEGNANFPNPPAALATVKTLLPEYITAVANAKGRDVEMVSIKNDKRTALRACLAELAEYVMATCNGDRSLLLSSGFTISGEKSTQVTPFIDKLEVELGPPGQATSLVRNVQGARAYMHEYATQPPVTDSAWTSIGSSYRTYTFKGLQSAAQHWFRVVAIGPSGQLVYSPVVTRIIQ